MRRRKKAASHQQTINFTPAPKFCTASRTHGNLQIFAQSAATVGRTMYSTDSHPGQYMSAKCVPAINHPVLKHIADNSPALPNANLTTG
jgi:hypothetical protein